MIYPELISLLTSRIKKNKCIDHITQIRLLLEKIDNKEINFLCSENILSKNWRIKWNRDRYIFIRERRKIHKKYLS